MSNSLIDIKNLDEALKKLNSTDPRRQMRNYRAAARAAMQPVKRAVREAAMQRDNPSTNTSIAKNVAIRSMNRRKLRQAGGGNGDIGVSVGIMGGAQAPRQSANSKNSKPTSPNPGGATWYWRLIEFGRAAFITKKISVRGRRINLFNPITGTSFGYKVKAVAPRPIMQNALPANLTQAIDQAAKKITAIINKSA